MPHLQQEALILLYEEDLSAAEAGKRLGRSAEATRQLHSRALKRLAARLGA